MNNPGTLPDMGAQSTVDVDSTDARNALDVDAVGPWAHVQALRRLPETAPAARVVHVFSGVEDQMAAG